jgi:uncharacterized membrane protein
MRKLVTITVAALLLSGCAGMTDVQKGASVGALAGAAIGGPWGASAAGISALQGAGIGVVAGGLAGALAADSLTNTPGYGCKPDPCIPPPPPQPPPPPIRQRAEQPIEK